MNIKYFLKVALFTLSILLISCSVTEEAPVVIEETKPISKLKCWKVLNNEKRK